MPARYVYALEDDDSNLVCVIAWDTLAQAVAAKLSIEADYRRHYGTDTVLSMRPATQAHICQAQRFQTLMENGTFADCTQKPPRVC